MHDPPPVRCLILACGNTLRSDDGVGPWLAAWAEERFARESCHHGHFAPAVDAGTGRRSRPCRRRSCSSTAPLMRRRADQIVPGSPCASQSGLATHHVGAAELLALSRDLYDSVPRVRRFLLTVGAGSIELGEGLSEQVTAALPEACSAARDSPCSNASVGFRVLSTTARTMRVLVQTWRSAANAGSDMRGLRTSVQTARRDVGHGTVVVRIRVQEFRPRTLPPSGAGCRSSAS